MISFFIKKNFCDGWDNVFWLILSNILCFAIIIACYFAGSWILQITSLPEWLPITISILLLILAAFGVFTFILSINDSCAKIADFKSAPIKEVFKNLKSCVKDGAILTFFFSGITFLAVVSVYFYLQMGNLLGLFLSALVLWGFLFLILALQWYFPLRAQMHGGFKKTLKKSFIMLLDNTGFSVFMFFYNLILIAISVFIFLIPGFSGLCLSMNNALRLRLYKYDWLEEHPGLSAKEANKLVPWGELIAEDYETLGPRPLKSFIFPWK